MTARITTSLVAALVVACGGTSPPTARPTSPAPNVVEEPPAELVPAVEGSVELTLRRTNGVFIDVGDLRGRRVVLFLLATFDTPSQMQMRPLERIAERHPDVSIIGIAAQPNARLLVDAYEHALSPSFPITFEPDETLTSGQSALGEIDSIPLLVVLDRRGVETGRLIGFHDLEPIERLLARAR